MEHLGPQENVSLGLLKADIKEGVTSHTHTHSWKSPIRHILSKGTQVNSLPLGIF